jgi:hypothetical protein
MRGKYKYFSSATKVFLGAVLLVVGLLLSSTEVHASSRFAVKCLALNLYFEARGEPDQGKIAVGKVTINRYKSGIFQKSICGVVYALGQFSWTKDKLSDIPKAGLVWNNVSKMANGIIDGTIKLDPSGKASHFYNPRKERASWASVYRRTARVGNHHFHQMPGFSKLLARRNANKQVNMNVLDLVGRFLMMNGINRDEIDPVVDPVDSPNYQNFLRVVSELPELDAGTEIELPPEGPIESEEYDSSNGLNNGINNLELRNQDTYNYQEGGEPRLWDL